MWFIAVNKKLEQIFIILHMNDFLAILIVLLAWALRELKFCDTQSHFSPFAEFQLPSTTQQSKNDCRIFSRHEKMKV